MNQDAVTKIYTDTKQYNINSANIMGNLPWSRISNLPTFFPSRISNITIDSDINLGSYKITKNGQEIIGLSNNSVTSPFIANNAVTNDKILSLDYSKLTNIPANTDNKISTLQVDADLNMENFKVTGPGFVTLNNQLVSKFYVSGQQLYPPIITSLVACYSLYTLDTEINTGMASVNYRYQSAGNSNAGYYFTLSGNSANRPKLIDHDGGSVPGFAFNFTGGQGLFTKSLNARGWNGEGNIAMFTCFVVMKYNKPNSSAIGREACISFDPPSYGKAFYAIDNRDGTAEPNTSYGPALFVGTNNGFVRRFRNNNGTGTPVHSQATLGI